MSRPHPFDSLEPGIKIALQMSPESTDDDFAFCRQLGVDHAVLWTDGAHASADYYASRRELFAKHGITVFGFGSFDVHNQDAIVLGLPNRDEKIEEYLTHLHNLGQAGIPYTTYAHMANGIWSSERETTRGGAPARAYNATANPVGTWHGVQYAGELTHGRRYEPEELWENFSTFIRVAGPAAEAAGVAIGIHPDDPPVPELGGIPRCIFSTLAGYQRALAIADSPNVGVCLCVGCWLEGGDLMGGSVAEAIDAFASQQKLFKVHFRNVDQPLPHFVEAFIDGGYGDLREIAAKLAEVDFRGVLIADHVPLMGGHPRVGTAYSVALMKAYVQAAAARLAALA